MTGTFVLFALLVFTQPSHPQTISAEARKPMPEVGWDSLQNRIVFANLAHRAGLEATVWAFLTFDSTGAIDSVIIRCMFEYEATAHVTPSEQLGIAERMFSQPVREALAGTKWFIPEGFSGWFSLRVQFIQSDGDTGHRLVKEVNKIKVKIPPTN
ncbi:MAG: hypothetical protein ACKVRP_08240 [Bacteroidota bacterium]